MKNKIIIAFSIIIVLLIPLVEETYNKYKVKSMIQELREKSNGSIYSVNKQL